MQTNLDTKMNTNMVKFKIDIHICRLLKFRYMAIVDLVDFIWGHRVRNPALMSKEYAFAHAFLYRCPVGPSHIKPR